MGVMIKRCLCLSTVHCIRGALIDVRKKLINRDLVMAVFAFHLGRVFNDLKRDLVKH